MTAVVGISAGAIGLIIGVMLPKQQQSYGMAVVTGTTSSSPEMQDYSGI